MKPSVVTRRGDKGKTDLYGSCRSTKDATRIHAIGDGDELNTLIGVILTEDGCASIRSQLEQIQHLLFRLGADIAARQEIISDTIKRVRKSDGEELESWITSIEDVLPPQTAFIIPGGSHVGALLHQARAVCRRAERWVVKLHQEESINPQIQIYLNRLSDYLFVAARKINIEKGMEETEVLYE